MPEIGANTMMLFCFPLDQFPSLSVLSKNDPPISTPVLAWKSRKTIGTSAFNMIQSYRDNRSTRKSRKKMGENPYVGSVRDAHAEAKYLSEGIAHRFERSKETKALSKWARWGVFAFVLFVILVLKIWLG